MSYRNGQRLPLEGGGALRLSVNPRARRLSIRIDARVGEAVAVAPSERRLGEVVAFARTKAGWIAERLAARIDTQPFEPGAVVTWLGRPVRLEASGGAGAARLIDILEEKGMVGPPRGAEAREILFDLDGYGAAAPANGDADEDPQARMDT